MIRKIEEKDREEYYAMSKIFFNSSAVSEPIEMDDARLEEPFHLAITNSSYLDIYVYDLGDSLGGYILLSYTYSNDFGGLLMTLEELFIKKELRGKGIGSEFMSFIEGIYPDEVAGIRLEVVDENYRAKKLYEKHGFEEREYVQMVKIVEEEENE